jgi:hypothetical protein
VRDFISRPLFICLRFYPYKSAGSRWNLRLVPRPEFAPGRGCLIGGLTTVFWVDSCGTLPALFADYCRSRAVEARHNDTVVALLSNEPVCKRCAGGHSDDPTLGESEVPTATDGLERICRPGFKHSKAEVLLLTLEWFFNVRTEVVELFSAHKKVCGVALSDFGTPSILAARRAWLRSRRTSVISAKALPNPAGHELMPQW